MAPRRVRTYRSSVWDWSRGTTCRSPVRVKPALSTMFSAGAAVLFLANPIVGAAIGAGTLIAQKMLDNPIDQMFSFEYLVTGSWSDPHVERTSRTPLAASAGESPGTITGTASGSQAASGVSPKPAATPEKAAR